MHGVSGFEDHLVSHAVVKRVFCELQQLRFGYPKRLAFFTYYNKGKSGGKFDLKSSKKEEIDCWVEASDEDYQKFIEALDCYETYQQVIEESNVKNEIGKSVPFELFRENFDPPLTSLSEKLQDQNTKN